MVWCTTVCTRNTMNARVEIDPFRKWKHFWAGRSTLNVDTADIPARRRLIRGGLKPSNCNHHMLHILSHLLHHTGPAKKVPDVHYYQSDHMWNTHNKGLSLWGVLAGCLH